MLKIKLHLFLPLWLLIILWCHAPAWGLAGIAEWEYPIPGGNAIGDNDGLPREAGTAIYLPPANGADTTIYVKNVDDFGFYEGAIIGQAQQGFFWFDQTTKTVQYFVDKAQLCATVAAKGLKFDNTLTFLPGSYPYDYYAIQSSLYFVIPFSILLLMHYLMHNNLPLSLSIDRILKGKWFNLQLYGLTVLTNLAVLSKRIHGSDIMLLNGMFTAISFAIVGLPLWGLSQLVLWGFRRVLLMRSGLFRERFATVVPFAQCLIFLGIFITGFSLTINPMSAYWTSIHYFSCP